MVRKELPFLAIIVLTGSLAVGQIPLIHYPFDEGGAPASTRNFGSLAPGSSPVIGHTLSGRANNGSFTLRGLTGAGNQVTTPLLVNFGNASFSVGFCINTQATAGTFQYVAGDGSGANTGWRFFVEGAAGAGGIRMVAGSSVDIPGGAGSDRWVHVLWVHDTAANQIRGYLDGVLVTTVPATPNLNNGNTFLIGRQGGAAADGLQTGALIDDFRFYNRVLANDEIAEWARHCRVDFRKLMITEASWGDPDGVEITNFGATPVNLNGWRLRWQDSASSIITSNSINVTINPNESIVIGESPIPDVAPGVQNLDLFPSIGTTSAAFTVGLIDSAGTVVDEVRVSSSSGAASPFTFGGSFRGNAVRGVISSTGGTSGVERIWGLDSNAGADWTDQPIRSLGLENRSSGPRGTDTLSIANVLITETDDSPDYIELRNNAAGTVNLQDWFFFASSGNTIPHTVLQPFPTSTVVSSGGFLVVGDAAATPAELPGGVTYVNAAPGNIPWLGSEYDCALYDRFGRLVDLMRTTGLSGVQVHNQLRAPSHWTEFTGAAGRSNITPGDDAVARLLTTTDSNQGSDWAPAYGRTMGSVNGNLVSGLAGHGLTGTFQDLDVRVTQGLFPGNGNTVIINAGPPRAGAIYSFFISAISTFGTGPFFGLGEDALTNYFIFSTVPPFFGVLDAQGSARYDFPPGVLPNLHLEVIFLIQQGGALAARTHVLGLDT